MMERVYGERVLSESTLNGVVVSQVVQRGAELDVRYERVGF